MTALESKQTVSYANAAARIQHYIADEDDALIHPASHTRLWAHGKKMPRAILYLHGYTDSTQQFAAMGELLFEHGMNVFVPRLPHHGYRARMSTEHGSLTIPELLQWTNDMVDTALDLGERLTVIGLSLGGVLATWVAEQRAEVDCVLILAPAYGTKVVPLRATRAVARIMGRLPNLFIWWDPRVRAATGIEYAYPRFATHVLARLYDFSGDLLAHARANPPAARRVWMITNANDFAVSNSICDAFVAAWRSHKPQQIQTYQFAKTLRLPHDFLDSLDSAVQPKVVYPRLLEIIQRDEPTDRQVEQA
jgi:pimeloyl-ACP methyl ester carboxylesterase